MVRTYKRKTDRNYDDEEYIRAAVKDVLTNGLSLRVAAEKHNIKKSKLGYLVKKAKQQGLDGISYKTNFKNRQIFPDEWEQMLAEYLTKCSNMFYGLTPQKTRELAYGFAVKNNVKIPLTWEQNKCAGVDWFSGFMRRNHSISLRKPESTSLARMNSFNKHVVGEFFTKLKTVLDKYGFQHHEIYNLDETGVTTVPPMEKVIGPRGQKQIGQVSSRERGELVTQVGIICATGNALPPVWVFPRVRFDEVRMMSGAPIGALGLVCKSGWMTSENFLKVLNFFHTNVRCCQEKPVLLILDNHESHLSCEGLNFCKDNGIVILTLPPHTSNKLQPLDRTVFGPFKKFFTSAAGSWMTSNPNTALNIYVLPKLCSTAWDKAASRENIKSGFRSTGIAPYNPDIFTDQDYLPSVVSDCPLPMSIEIPKASSAVPLVSTSALTSGGAPLQTLLSPIDKSFPSFSPEEIQPFPKGQPTLPTTRGRRRGRCMIATDTPEKMEIENRKVGLKNRRKLVMTCFSSEDEPSNLCEEPGDSPMSFEESSETSENSQEEQQTLIVEGDYVVVKFPQKRKGIIYYIGKICEIISADSYEVTFLRRKGCSFIYPVVEDKSIVTKYEISRKIQLLSTRRGKYYFKNRVIGKFKDLR